MPNKLSYFFIDARSQLSASTRRYTPEGYLIADALIARTGIQEYQGHELPENIGIDIDPNKTYRIYRSPKEVFDPIALQSFSQKPVTNEHPHDVGGLVNANTAVQKLVGVSGIKAVKEGDQIKIPIILYDASTINDVENGKIGLSAGYTADLKMRPGVTPDGKPYDGAMVNIRGNHTAICYIDTARGGRDCRILDDNKRIAMRQQSMQADKDIRQDDNVPDLSDINQIGQMIQTLAGSIKEGFASIIEAVRGDKDGEKDEDTMDEPENEGEDTDDARVVPLTDEDEDINNKLSTSKNKIAKNSKDEQGGMRMTDSRKAIVHLQQQIAYLKGQLQVSKKVKLTDSQINKVVSERVKLLREAEQVLPGQLLDSLSSLEIKKLVLSQGMPAVVLDSNPAFIDGAYHTYINGVIQGSNSAYGLASAINDSYALGGEGGQDIFADVDSGKMADEAFKKLQERRSDQFEGRKV